MIAFWRRKHNITKGQIKKTQVNGQVRTGDISQAGTGNIINIINNPAIQDSEPRFELNRCSGVAEEGGIGTSNPLLRPELGQTIRKAYDANAGVELGDLRSQYDSRIKEAISFMQKGQMERARALLQELVGELRNKAHLSYELARVYNNIGVSYHQPPPLGDIASARVNFTLASQTQPSVPKYKINLAMTFINENTDQSISEGYDRISAIWHGEKDKNDIDSYILWAIAYATYKRHGAKSALDFFVSLDVKIAGIAQNTDCLLQLLSQLYFEIGDYAKALEMVNKALSIDSLAPELIDLKARIMMRIEVAGQLRRGDPDEIPILKDYIKLEEALKLFNQSENLAQNQGKVPLIQIIGLGKLNALIILKKFEEAATCLHNINASLLPMELMDEYQHIAFVVYLNNRNFPQAYSLIAKIQSQHETTYADKRRFARLFFNHGGSEQARDILIEIEPEAKELGDCFYWIDLCLANVLLDRKNEAIAAIETAKKLSENTGISTEHRKNVLSNYNAITARYSSGEGGGESDRLIKGLFEYHKEFAEDNIIRGIPGIDEEGQLTPEMKEFLSQQKVLNKKTIDRFKSEFIVTYRMQGSHGRTYAEFICTRDDPDFTIYFDFPSPEFISHQDHEYSLNSRLVLDYLTLLDLSGMELLGFLERINKDIYVSQSLFIKIQNELIATELPELRRLREFLLTSSHIKWLSNPQIVAENLADNTGQDTNIWLLESIEDVRLKGGLFVSNDFRLLQMLYQKKIQAINAMPLIRNLLSAENIDKKMYSHCLRYLASRFYIFISYDAEDLLNIAIADKLKITLGSYHLIRHIHFPESNIMSFMHVFAQFLERLWRLDILSEDKINWLHLISNETITSLRSSSEPTKAVARGSAYQILEIMWKIAIELSDKKERELLEPLAKEVLIGDDLIAIAESVKQMFLSKGHAI